MAGQPGFFDLADRYEALSAADEPLERLAAVVDFEVFRGPLVAALRRSVRGKGGRPPFDPVLMFKVLVLRSHTARTAGRLERFPHELNRWGFPLRLRCDSYVDAPLARAICRDGFDRLLSYVRPVCAAFFTAAGPDGNPPARSLNRLARV